MSFPVQLVVEEALRKQFPDQGVSVELRGRGARLATTFWVKGKRVVMLTPETIHADALSAAEWIHRIASEIKARS